MLPTQVLEYATTYDLYVYDVTLSYTNYLRDKAERQSPNRTAPAMPEAATPEMIERLENWKRKNSGETG